MSEYIGVGECVWRVALARLRLGGAQQYDVELLYVFMICAIVIFVAKAKRVFLFLEFLQAEALRSGRETMPFARITKETIFFVVGTSKEKLKLHQRAT